MGAIFLQHRNLRMRSEMGFEDATFPTGFLTLLETVLESSFSTSLQRGIVESITCRVTLYESGDIRM